jgi:hypothetical protein
MREDKADDRNEGNALRGDACLLARGPIFGAQGM